MARSVKHSDKDLQGEMHKKSGIPLLATRLNYHCSLNRYRPSQVSHGMASGQGWSIVAAETLYHRDEALLYIAYVMLIWAVPIPVDRWHCSLWP